MAEPGAKERLFGLAAAAVARGSAAREAGVAELLAERARWVLWLPVVLGAGAALWFQLPFVVPYWASLSVAAIAALIFVWRLEKELWLAALAMGVLLFAAGMALSAGRTARVAAPVIAEEMGPVRIEGRVTRVEVTEEGFRRLTIAPTSIEDLASAELPHFIRVSVRQRNGEVLPGQHVSALAELLPPSGPAMPGAFDFARAAWFDRLGAVGFTYSAPEVMTSEERGSIGGWASTQVAGLRFAMARRVREVLPNANGGIAAALITGDRSGVTEEDWQAFRGSGLAHLLAISGLHMALVGGLLFLSIRTCLALRERWALTRPIKKYAALGALIGAFAYLVISGGSISTQRAFIMIAIAFLAVLANRPVLTMRTVAIAAMVILVIAPESVTQVGFQMSFAAVIALIALSEKLQPWLAQGRIGEAGWIARIAAYVAGLCVTSLVAGLTIAPFAAYHFNRFSNYEVFANLVAMPVMAFWVMPAGILAVITMPLGLDAPFLHVMGWGIDVIRGTGHNVAGWPGAESVAGAVSPWVLAAIAFGGAWIAIWQRPWRWAGLAAIAVGLAAFPLARGPDLIIESEGRTFAVRDTQGDLAVLFPRRSSYEQEIWLRRDGDARSLREAAGDFPCDGIGCIAQLPHGEMLAYTIEPQALIDDCQSADILVTPIPVRIHCPAPDIIIDYYALREGGAHAITFARDGPHITRAEDSRRGRPWSRAGRENQ